MIPRRFSLLCLGALAVLGGCKRPEIRVYTAPREEGAGGEGGKGTSSALGGERAKPKIAYQTPEGWTLTPSGQLSLASFLIEGEGGQKATVSVTALGNLAGREDSLVNMWREQVGAEPLPKEAAAKALTPVRVAGWPGQLFEVNGTKEGRASRIVTAIVNRPEGTWFFKLAGDEPVVQAQKGVFADFLRDFEFVEGDATTPEVAEATRMPAAAVATATPAPVVAPAATPVPAPVSTAVASVPLATPAPAGPATVPVPVLEVIPAVPVSPLALAPLMTRPIPLAAEAPTAVESSAPVASSPVAVVPAPAGPAGMPAGSEKPVEPALPAVSALVAPVAPPPLASAPAIPVPVATPAPATPVPVPPVPVPPVPVPAPAPTSAPAEPAAPAAAASGWKIPAAWQQLEPGPMQVAKFSVPDQGSAKAVVSVSVFGSDTGGTLSNVNRWRGQLGLEPVDEAGLAAIVQPLATVGAGAVVTDFAKENRRLVGAIVPRGGQWWFYKLLGEGPAVEAAKAAFLDFVPAPPPAKVE